MTLLPASARRLKAGLPRAGFLDLRLDPFGPWRWRLPRLCDLKDLASPTGFEPVLPPLKRVGKIRWKLSDRCFSSVASAPLRCRRGTHPYCVSRCVSRCPWLIAIDRCCPRSAAKCQSMCQLGWAMAETDKARHFSLVKPVRRSDASAGECARRAGKPRL